ncbi:hypothetical protein [Anaerosporobacter sp.]|uniref:hypothetical protein n=1 Tax=Anaerosporobacter sp. TaxID=1872529 RepID=UPI00286EE968|nr:hypothetical protein [Anaerosporobacter sp.]
MKKRLLAVLMGLVMTVALVGCGSNNTEVNDTKANNASVGEKQTETGDSVSTETTTYPKEKVLIGVELYDPTDSETIAIQEYFAKLAKTYNVEFKYSEAIADADSEMKFIEDCAMAGCKGFIGYYNVTGLEQVQSVIDYGMYFYGMDEDEVYEEFGENENYLGIVSAGGDDYDAGKALGEWVMEKGYTNVVYANGGADFGVDQFVKRQNGFMDAIDDSVEVTVVSGFPGDQFFADQSSALSKQGLQAVVASFNGVDFWAQPIASAGLAGTVELATIGSVNTTYVDAFEGGLCSFLVSKNVDTFGFGIAAICNAVDGNADAWRADGKALRMSTEFWKIANAEDCKTLNDVMKSEGVYTAEQLMSLSVAVNENVTVDTVKDLVATGTMEAILNR